MRSRSHILALVCLLLAPGLFMAAPPEPAAQDPARDKLIVESLLRLKGVTIDGKPNLQSAVLRHAATVRGSAVYFQLVERFRIKQLDDDLFLLALEKHSSSEGVQAATILSKAGQLDRFIRALQAKEFERATTVAALSGYLDTADIIPPLVSLLNDATKPRSLRTAATYALGKTILGQKTLLKELQENGLPDDLSIAAANVLYGSSDESIRENVKGHLELPAGSDTNPLPPLPQLLELVGDVSAGQAIFRGKATCNKCHKVRGDGKEVGPDLSEIGSKLSHEALYISVLDPSAGISHSFETYNIILNSGNVLSGILVSKTDDAITIKTAEALERKIASSDIDEMIKSTVSMMPADLQKTMTAQELAHVVQYLSSLKKQ